MTLIALVLVSHLYDLSTFLACVRVFGIEGEGNPLARAAYESGGDIGVALWKAAFVGVFIGLSFMVKREYRNTVIGTAVLVGLIGGLVNTASLMTLP